MAQEEDPWGFDEDTEETKEVPIANELPTERKEIENTPLDNTDNLEENILQQSDEVQSAPLPPEDDGYRKPVQLYRHWVRPKFLQYKYMYNYRTNYYDDVIDYLDKKQVGVSREIPRPQTWAERVLRTNYTGRIDSIGYTSITKRNNQLIQTLAASIRTYNYHTKAYLNQKYGHVL